MLVSPVGQQGRLGVRVVAIVGRGCTRPGILMRTQEVVPAKGASTTTTTSTTGSTVALAAFVAWGGRNWLLLLLLVLLLLLWLYCDAVSWRLQPGTNTVNLFLL